MRFMLDTVALGHTFSECCGTTVLLLFCQCSILFIFIAFFLVEAQLGKAWGPPTKVKLFWKFLSNRINKNRIYFKLENKNMWFIFC